MRSSPRGDSRGRREQEYHLSATKRGGHPHPSGQSRSAIEHTVRGIPAQPNDRRLSVQNTAPSYLSENAQQFISVTLGDFSSCANLINAHRDILNENANDAVKEAVRFQAQGKTAKAKSCVQLCLILMNHTKMSPREFQKFFENLIAEDKQTNRTFLDEFDKVMNAVKDKVKDPESLLPQSQNAPKNLENPQDVNIGYDQAPGLREPKKPVSRSDPRQRRHSTGDRPPSAYYRQTKSNRLGPVDENPSVNSKGPDTRRPELGSVDEDASTNSTVAPSRVPDIRGSERDHEEFDQRYSKRRDAKKFFRVGRVFALLWHEGAGDGNDHISQVEIVRFGQRVFSHIRRMVVVQERYGYCICVPINTYNYQGVAKSGLNSEEKERHAVIHAADYEPYTRPEEQGTMTKLPIAVTMNEGQKLDCMSRINFGKPFSVEWNVKVMNVGRIAEESRPAFESYWERERSR